MKCLVCETEILKRDGYFWGNDIKDKDDTDGPVHDDCLIRDLESCGLYSEAEKIFEEACLYYNRQQSLT